MILSENQYCFAKQSFFEKTDMLNLIHVSSKFLLPILIHNLIYD